MAYSNLHRKNSSSSERCVSMNGTQLPEGLWQTCRWQPMSLSVSTLWAGQKLDTLDDDLKCHCCTVISIWFNVLHYLFTHHSSNLVSKGSGAVGSPPAQRAFLNCCGLQQAPGVCQKLACGGTSKIQLWFLFTLGWRLQWWFCLYRAFILFLLFFSHEDGM